MASSLIATRRGVAPGALTNSNPRQHVRFPRMAHTLWPGSGAAFAGSWRFEAVHPFPLVLKRRALSALVARPLLIAGAAMSASCTASTPRGDNTALEDRAELTAEQQLRNEQFRAGAAQLQADQRKAREEAEKAVDARNKEFERDGY